MEKRSDKELMKLIRKKEARAFKMLYQRYESAIFNFVYRFTGSREIAQELIQETFARVWQAAHTFDGKRGQVKGWLYAIALNLSRSEMSRKEYAYHYTDVEEVNRGYVNDKELTEEPQVRVEREEMRELIRETLGRLPEYMREVIILKNYQQLKFREIAEVTDTPESTLKARYHRAIHLVRKTILTLEGQNHA